MPEEQAKYETSNTPKTPRTAARTLQIIQNIAEHATEHGDDLEGALHQIHYQAGLPTESEHPHTDFYSLAQRTIRWAKDKGIHDEGTPEGQADKLLEEATETWAAVRGLSDADLEELREHADIIVERGAPGGAEDRHEEVRDGFGDIFVTLVNTAYAYLRIAHSKGGPSYASMWLMLCWDDVLREIEQRSGEMRDGVFVKSEDL